VPIAVPPLILPARGVPVPRAASSAAAAVSFLPPARSAALCWAAVEAVPVLAPARGAALCRADTAPVASLAIGRRSGRRARRLGAVLTIRTRGSRTRGSRTRGGWTPSLAARGPGTALCPALPSTAGPARAAGLVTTCSGCARCPIAARRCRTVGARRRAGS